MLIGSGTNSRHRNVLQSTKLKGVGDLKNILTSDVKMQFRVCPVVFDLVLFQYFLIMLPSIYFGIRYILCHYMLEVCNLLFNFDFYRGLQLRDCMNLRRNFELYTFKQV